MECQINQRGFDKIIGLIQFNAVGLQNIARKPIPEYYNKIKTNTLLVQDDARVVGNTFGEGKGGNLTVDAQDVQLIGNQQLSGLFTDTSSTGDAGNITIKTNTLLVRDGAQVSAATSDAGKGGNIIVDAQDVQLIGSQQFTGLFTNAFSTGDAGNLTIKTNTLLVRDGAEVNTATFGAGKGGNIIVDAQDVQLIGSQQRAGLFTNAFSTGDAGNLTIKTNTLLVRDGAQVNTATLGAGKGGNIIVDAQDVQLIGNQQRAGLFTEASSTGDAGNLTIKTNTLLVRDGAEVSTATSGAGKGGNIIVDAQDVQLIGSPQRAGLFTNAFSTGDAGNLTIKTNTLLVRDGAHVNTATLGAGKGGNIIVDAQDVQLIGNQQLSGLFTEAFSTGDAGNSTIKTNTLLVRDGALVSAATFGKGEGGNIIVDAEDIQLIGESSALATSAESNSTGNAGDLTIKADTLLVRDGAAITVQSSGTGTAGIMTLNSPSIRLDNNALLSANTRSAKVDPNREQATININSENLIISRNSNIFTNARGENVIGGNINIDTDFLIGFENSDISANSGNSRGGNVRINASGIFGTQFRDVGSDKTSDITATGASSELNGNVEINTPDVDPNSGLVNLLTVPVDTQVAQTCQAGGNLAKSSFTITGRGGLPPNPGDTLNADAVQVDLVALNPSTRESKSPLVTIKPTTATPKPIVEATGWVMNAKGEVQLIANAPATTPHGSWQNPSN